MNGEASGEVCRRGPGRTVPGTGRFLHVEQSRAVRDSYGQLIIAALEELAATMSTWSMFATTMPRNLSGWPALELTLTRAAE